MAKSERYFPIGMPTFEELRNLNAIYIGVAFNDELKTLKEWAVEE